MGTINLGSTATVETNGVDNTAVVKLDDDNAVAFWNDTSNTQGDAAHLDLTADPPTVGTSVLFNAATCSNISACRLSDTTGIVVYSTGATYARHFTLSGSTISYGTEVTVDANVNPNHVIGLTSTKAVVVYVDVGTSTDLKGAILDVSGTTITVNTAFNIDTGSITDARVAALASDKAAVVYTDGAVVEARVLSGITTTATVSGATTLDASVNILDVRRMDAVTYASNSVFAVWWTRQTPGDILDSIAFSVSGTTISPGSVTTLKSNGSNYRYNDPECASLGSGNVAIAHSNSVTGTNCEIFTASISGTTITDNNDEVEFDADDCVFYALSLDDNDSGSPVILWADSGDSDKGKAIYAGITFGLDFALTHSANAIPGAILV